MTTSTPTAPAAPAAAPKPTAPAVPAAPARQPSFADKLAPKPGDKPATPPAPNGNGNKPTTRPDAKAPETPPAADPTAPVKVSFVVDGKQIALDMAPEEAAFLEKNPKFKERFQKSLGADKRLQEGVKLRQQAEEIIELLRDPDAVFEHVLKHPSLGHKDVRAMVEGWLLKQIELERMDPKDRELMTTKQELEAIKNREEMEKKAAAQQRHEAMVKDFSENYQKDIITAVSSSGLPANEETVGRVAFYLHSALTQYGKELKAADVMPLVKQDYERMVRKLFSSSNGQAIAEILGEEGLKKIRQYDIERLRNPHGNGGGGNPPPRGPGNPPPSHPNGKKPMTTDEWREFLQKRREGGE